MVRHARRELADRLCVSSRASRSRVEYHNNKPRQNLSLSVILAVRVLSARQEKIDSSISSSKVIEFPFNSVASVQSFL